jgi:hypothetical protein
MIINEISKGIAHIEDLSYSDIIDVVTNLPDYQITEKVDGAQILFGIDEHGFYTSRETKGGERIYNEAEYGIDFSSTYKRSAHKLLEQMLPVLKGAGLRPGDQVEAEVLYGQVPNVVPYSADTNYLIFLRTTEGVVNIDRLKQKLDGQSVSISLMSPFTDDGKTIGLREETNNWKFARVPVIERNYEFHLIKQGVIEMKKFLQSKDVATGQTILSLVETPLNKIPNWVKPDTWKDVKEYIRERRVEIRSMVESDYIFPLKETLLNGLVRNTASSFGPLVEDGGWIEGVVLRHKNTGKMVKLVDKDVFGTVRESAWQKRNMLTERARSVDSDSGFLGKLYLDMANSIGHPELGTMQAKNYLRKAGAITEDRLNTLSAGVDINTVKSYWISLLEIREEELERDLDKYVEDTNAKNPLEEAIRQRTLQTFASIFEKIRNLKEDTKTATSISNLLTALVGKQLGEI